MALVIKRKVSLDFIGEDYIDSFLTFKAISVSEYEGLKADVEKFEKDQSGSVEFIIDILKKHFLSGKGPNEKDEITDLVSDDINALDPVSLVEVFKAFTGTDIDPKAGTPLTMPSSTVSEAPSNS
jgi:hypothetical protein